jgi:uncharacterized coiled-coil protein SlyX
MIDAAYSRQKHQENRAALVRRRRLIIPLVAAALVLIGGGCVTVWAFGSSKDGNPGLSTSVGKPSDELLETAKGLEVTQQQAVDQLQIVQDQLAAQQVETKRLSEQITSLTEKLDLLQQSVANAAAPQPKPAARR